MGNWVVATRVDRSRASSEEEIGRVHMEAAQAVQRECKDVAWVASYRVEGSPYDFVDVVNILKGDSGKPEKVLRKLGTVESAWWPATGSAFLRAPGGGGPGGGGPGGGGPGGGAPGG